MHQQGWFRVTDTHATPGRRFTVGTMGWPAASVGVQHTCQGRRLLPRASQRHSILLAAATTGHGGSALIVFTVLGLIQQCGRMSHTEVLFCLIKNSFLIGHSKACVAFYLHCVAMLNDMSIS